MLQIAKNKDTIRITNGKPLIPIKGQYKKIDYSSKVWLSRIIF